MKHFVFKLGPIDATTPMTSAYFAYPGTEAHRVSFAEEDFTGVGDLLKRLHGEILICEPQLEDAAQQLGVACESYTPERAHALGMVAFDLALPGRLASVEPPELIYAFGTACAEYFHASPWDQHFAGQSIRVLFTSDVRRGGVARILGPAGEQRGLALFDPDAYRLLAQQVNSGEILETMLRSDLLGVAFSNEPRFAVDAMHRAYELDAFPVPTKLSVGDSLPLNAEDVLALCATLRAISALQETEEAGSAEVQVGDLHVAAIAWLA